MKINSIKAHLRPYKILGRRRTTINHAFASAIAPYDEFDLLEVERLMDELGVRSSGGHLCCAYCNEPAQTWDHIQATVDRGEFSGFGHQLRNLLPCCKSCNSKKGNREWSSFFSSLSSSEDWYGQRLAAIQKHVLGARANAEELRADPGYKKYLRMRTFVLKRLDLADRLALELRERHFGVKPK